MIPRGIGAQRERVRKTDGDKDRQEKERDRQTDRHGLRERQSKKYMFLYFIEIIMTLLINKQLVNLD